MTTHTLDTDATATLAKLVEIYAAGRTEQQYGYYRASTPEMTALLDTIHAAWMDSLCRTSAGLLPFDDTHDERAPDWLRQLQDAKVGR
jgi:hypothetical protein